MNVLVVAAWEPELTRFRELATDEVRIEVLGVGLVDAGIAAARALARHAPDRAVLLGTCGGLSPGLGIAEVIVGSRVVLSDEALLAGRAALPPPMVAEVALDVGLHDAFALAGARSARIVNTLGVTVDDALASRLAALAEVEHLEAFAFARACAAFSVPAAVVLGVANPVGARGPDAWRAHHVEASARAAEVAFEALRRSTTTPSPARP